VLEADAIDLAHVAERVARSAVVGARPVVVAGVTDEDLVRAAADDGEDARVRSRPGDVLVDTEGKADVVVRDRVALQVQGSVDDAVVPAGPVETAEGRIGRTLAVRRGRALEVERSASRDPDVLRLVRRRTDDAATEVAAEQPVLLRVSDIDLRPDALPETAGDEVDR